MGQKPNTELLSSIADTAELNAHANIPEGFSKGIEVTYVTLNTKEWGHGSKDESDNQIVIKEITIPFVDPENSKNKFLIQALTYDFEVPSKNEVKHKKERLTLVAWGGGGSDAYSVVSYITRLRDAIKEEPNFPYDVHLVIMPHLVGQPKTGDFEKSENTIKEAARIESLMLQQIPELEVSEDIAFLGFSAGGAMATETAAIMQNKKIHFIALCDSAGMADIENVMGKVAQNSSVEAFKKFREQGLSATGAIKELVNELYAGMPTPRGVPRNILELAQLQNPLNHDQNVYYSQLAKEWGFTPDKSNLGLLDIRPIESDSTAHARKDIKCPVIFAPILGSEAVNSLWARLKDGLGSYMSFEDLAQIEKNVQNGTDETMFGLGDTEISAMQRRELNRMFPNAKEVLLAASTDKTHSGPFGENGQPFWNNVLNAATRAMEIYD